MSDPTEPDAHLPVGTAPRRPTLTSHIPSPLEGLKPPCPTSVNISICLWALCGLVGVALLMAFLADLDEVQAALRLAVGDRDPDLDEAGLDRAVERTTAVAVGLIIAPLVVALGLTMMMGRRRHWARVLLAVVGVLVPPLAAAGVALMSVETYVAPWWVGYGLVAEAALVLAGIVAMFLPRANTWFRTRRYVVGLTP